MPDTIKLEVATPDAIVYSDDVNMVTLTAVDGQIGILPHHIRLITQLVPGEMVVRKDGHEEFLAVGEGLIDVSGDHIDIVTDMAIPSDSIDEAKAEEARRQAETHLHEKLSSQEVASVQASLARSLAQIYVRRRHRKI
jgi:F-type H+-transporting ATPase subunit epsilon